MFSLRHGAYIFFQTSQTFHLHYLFISIYHPFIAVLDFPLSPLFPSFPSLQSTTDNTENPRCLTHGRGRVKPMISAPDAVSEFAVFRSVWEAKLSQG